MVCRHKPGDPECSSNKSPAYIYDSSYNSPDATKYEIVDVQQEGNHLVMKVKYPNCSRCAFEGTKVLVFVNVTPLAAIKWNRIDPHFRDTKPFHEREAPSPAARFPATKEGWEDALTWARSARLGGRK